MPHHPTREVGMAGFTRRLALRSVAVILVVAASLRGSAGAAEKGENHVDFRGAGASGEECHIAGLTTSFAADAHLLPGSRGAELRGGDMGDGHVDFSGGDRGNGHIDFRITIDPGGRVDVNGEEFARCDPAEGCHLALAWSASGGAMVVEVVAADGALVAAQYHLAEAPTELRIEAAEIRWLAVTPQ